MAASPLVLLKQVPGLVVRIVPRGRAWRSEGLMFVAFHVKKAHKSTSKCRIHCGAGSPTAGGGV